MHPDRNDPNLIEEAKRYPDGYVYVIDEAFRDKDDIPPQHILGAWKVNSIGEIVGDFMPNPNYRKVNE